jgi:enoyl-CoA hydratase/carnithine racemase
MTSTVSATTAREVRLERAGAIATLVLDRPHARNALSAELMSAIEQELAAIAADRSIKVVILGASGPVFSSGHDLKEMRACRDRAVYQGLFQQCSRMMLSIVRLPQPVIARVQGVATAAGCQLVASCDLAVAAASARFATPGVNIGLFCSTPMVALSRNVSRKQAMEMLLTGEMVGAEEAQRIGLVNKVVPDSQLEAATAELAATIASKSGHVLRIGKEAFYRQLELGLEDAYAYTSQVMTENMMARDAEEGIGAFLDKRKPEWTEG